MAMTYGMGEAQDKRIAKALSEGPEMAWTKAPSGWVCSTASGGCYLVSNEGTGSCSCPDYKHNCSGVELVCKHIVALRIRLAEESFRTHPPVVADREAEAAAKDAKLDELWDRIYG